MSCWDTAAWVDYQNRSVTLPTLTCGPSTQLLRFRILTTVFERVLSHGRFGSHAILAQILVCIAFTIPYPTRLTQEVRR